MDLTTSIIRIASVLFFAIVCLSFCLSIVAFCWLWLAPYCERTLKRFRLKWSDQFGEKKRGYGIIVQKEMIPSRTETYMSRKVRVSEGKFAGVAYHYEIPETVTIPAQFGLYLKVNRDNVFTEVSEKLYGQVNEGDSVSVCYKSTTPGKIRVLAVEYPKR